MISMNETKTIMDEWERVEVPPPPELQPIRVDPKVTALLILDIQRQNCNAERRPRCVESVPKIQNLLKEARARGICIVHSLIPKTDVSDIWEEVTPLEGEPVVEGVADKFLNTDLKMILEKRGIKIVILVGSAAHGAVLHTATGAALRGLQVIVPVDGMSADLPYAEQYTAWHLANSPASRNQTRLTRFSMIQF